MMRRHGDNPGGQASPPCLAHEIAPGWFDPPAGDPEQARKMARWRRAERRRLPAGRRALRVAEAGIEGGGP